MRNAFLIALQFLTRLPLPQNISKDLHADPETLARSVLTYPLVGALIGFVLIVILFLIDWQFPHTRKYHSEKPASGKQAKEQDLTAQP